MKKATPHAICHPKVRTTCMRMAGTIQRDAWAICQQPVCDADRMVAAVESRPRVAPVKPEFIRPSAPRAVIEAVTSTGDGAHAVAAPKSRRQQQKVCAFAACVRLDGVSSCMHASYSPSPRRPEQRQHCRHGAYIIVRSPSDPQERAESRQGSGLCHSLVRGVPCQFGERCRFNHDVEAFLRSKGPELPGRCPFLSAGTCVYGGSASVNSPHRDGSVLHLGSYAARNPDDWSLVECKFACEPAVLRGR